MNDCQIIILAAGRGTRMDSDLPKVMHKVGSKPMLYSVIEHAREVTNDVIIVISREVEPYLSEFSPITTVMQTEPKGTGYAVFLCNELINPDKIVAVLYADNPLISSKTIKNLINKLDETKTDIMTLAFLTDEPAAYGRIVTNDENQFIKIVEFKQATTQEKEIKLCNSGVCAYGPGILQKFLTPEWIASQENSDKEIYLTDLVERGSIAGDKVGYFICDSVEALGVNTPQELINANFNFSRITEE